MKAKAEKWAESVSKLYLQITKIEMHFRIKQALMVGYMSALADTQTEILGWTISVEKPGFVKRFLSIPAEECKQADYKTGFMCQKLCDATVFYEEKAHALGALAVLNKAIPSGKFSVVFIVKSSGEVREIS